MSPNERVAAMESLEASMRRRMTPAQATQLLLKCDACRMDALMGGLGYEPSAAELRRFEAVLIYCARRLP